jgi:very-short-patch-repair endonuclease
LKVFYNPKLTERAKELRKNATFAERLLWKRLRSRQLLGYQFMRQKPINNYIADFYCSKLHLVIEIDGQTHSEKEKYDKHRENYLKDLGLTVIRFDGYYIINHIDDALESIVLEIKKVDRNTTP